jgi:Tol biopolymer transport system component
MKRSRTALAVALSSFFVIAGCNDYGNTFQNNTGASISFLSPANISAGSPDFTLTVNGGGFVAKTFIEWNGKKLTTTDNLDTAGNIRSVSAVIPAELVAKPGAATVITQNPFSGAGNNGLSNPVTFIINFPPNPMPTLTSIAPSSIAACGSSCGDASFTLDIQGTNFLSSSSDPTQVSQVRWTAGATQTILVTTSVSATDIKATVPGSLYSTAGTAMVAVFNPPAPQVPVTGGTPQPSGGGGGSSNSQTFTITADGSASAHATKSALPEETPSVSSDGRFVSYTGSENGHTQIFLRDTCEGAPTGCNPLTTLLSTAADGTAANDDSNSPSLSANGRYVAFSSAATNLVENAPAGRQIYLRDTCAGSDGSCSPSTQIVSTDSNGALTGTTSLLPSISASGRFVAFLAVTLSHAAHQQASGTSNSGFRQVFVRDTCLGASSCTPKTSRISLQPGDGAGVSAKPTGPAVGASGRHIALSAQAATLFTRSVAVDDRVFLAITKSDE